MKSAVLFSGPTLAGVCLALDVERRPPARRGDIYRAARDGARLIGLVDGVFDQVNAVAHKEILWAMARGAHVYGAASMGALRAAELHAFGMEGVGAVFAQLHAGDLADDDEVAVAHAGADDGWRPLSEAMVNIRATLAAAAAAGVVGAATHALLVRVAKRLFYADRAFPVILAHAEAEDANAAELHALCGFLPRGRVEQKQKDALALVARLAEHLRVPPPPKQVRFHFAHTDAWEALCRRVDATG